MREWHPPIKVQFIICVKYTMWGTVSMNLVHYKYGNWSEDSVADRSKVSQMDENVADRPKIIADWW